MNALAETAGRAAPTSAAAVANEFLKLAEQESGLPAVDQMKLQKLLFYAHAWHLAYRNGPLFDEDFEAWPWGPVIRGVYTQTLDYGSGQITGRISEFGPTDKGFCFTEPDGVPPELKDYIKSVWDAHKRLSGIQLSNSTHAPGEPWTIVKDRLGTGTKPRISNELITAVFKEKLKRVAPNPAA